MTGSLLWWFITDRTLVDDTDPTFAMRLGVRRAFPVAFPRLSRVGVSRLACGCERRFRFVAYDLGCPHDHAGWLGDGGDEPPADDEEESPPAT